MSKAGRKKKGNEKYQVKTIIGALIKQEVERRRVKGIKVLQADIFEELAELTGCSVGMIDRIKRGKVNPSLTVAILIAQYFKKNVEEIWFVVGNENYVDDRERCRKTNCNRLEYSKGLCLRHYNRMMSHKHNQKRLRGV